MLVANPELRSLLQVWSGALTWCPRCGPPGGTSSVRRGRSSRNLPRAPREKPWRPGGRRVVTVTCAWFPASMTLHRQTPRTGDVVRPTTAEGCRRAAANLLPAWRQLLPSLSSRHINQVAGTLPAACTSAQTNHIGASSAVLEPAYRLIPQILFLPDKWVSFFVLQVHR